MEIQPQSQVFDVDEQNFEELVLKASKERVIVVDFWAPWCAPCNVELPVLSTLSDRFKGEVDFVGMSVELDDVTSVQESIKKFGLEYFQFFADEKIMDRFFVSAEGAALPSTFVFDRDGGIRRVFLGAITESDIEGLLLSFRDESEAEALASFGRDLFQI